MLDKILGILSTADWISPTVGLAEDLIGGMTTIVAERPPGWSGREMIRELQRQGVRVGKTPQIIGNNLVCTVDDADAARRILNTLR